MRPSKKTAFWTIMTIISVCCIAHTINQRFPRIINKKGYPQRVLSNPSITYTFNPSTIFSSLSRKSEDVFIAASEDSEASVLDNPGNLVWNDKDFLEVANAVHLFAWGEFLDNWNIYWADYSIYQCEDNIDGFNDASYFFYKREDDEYIVHHLFIKPQIGTVTTSTDNYPYTGKWKGIQYNKSLSVDAKNALETAENNGGNIIRSVGEKECYIRVQLAPDNFLFQFPVFPLCYRSFGWDVTYWQDIATLSFSRVIDPFTGRNY